MQASKQENLAHVILATSDYAFLNWLAGGESSHIALKHFLLKAVIAGPQRPSLRATLSMME